MAKSPIGGISVGSWRLIIVVVSLWLFAAAIAVLPSVVGSFLVAYKVYLPGYVRAALPLALLALVCSLLQIGPRMMPGPKWERLDRLAGLAIGRPLVGLLTGLAVIWLACWVPQFLTWPWWVDLDHFSMMAHAWDSGILPYRDVIDYNFPGPIYLMWALGKTFGWDQTLPALAFDVGVVVGLGVALVYWSRALYGSRLPGLCAYLFILVDYFGLNYSMIAQRDWYATLLVGFGLMAIEARRGRGSRYFAAAMLGASLAFRPYGSLFIPAFVSAIGEAENETKAWALAVLEWLAAAALMTLVAFSPLLVAGVFDDFVASLRYVQPGGAYNRNSSADFLERLREGVVNFRFPATLGALVLVGMLAEAKVARSARTWAIALVAVAFYKPLSPVAHNYLNIPRVLIESVAFAPLVGWLVGKNRLTSAVKLVLLVSPLTGVVITVPEFCDQARSLKSLGPLVRGKAPRNSPQPGILLDRPHEPYSYYTWNDYQEALDYVRQNTRSLTRVANVLRKHPFPAFNGPAGRLTPFPSVGGMMWLRWVGPQREHEFARALEEAGDDTVVVWAPREEPNDENLRLPHLLETIHRCYRFEAKFGVIEVWRRKPRE